MVLPFRSRTILATGEDVGDFRDLCGLYGRMIGHQYSDLAQEDAQRVQRLSNISLPEACATVFDHGMSRFTMSSNQNGLDLVMFSMPLGGSELIYEQRGKVKTARADDVIVSSTAEVLRSHSRQVGKVLAVAVPRKKLLPLVRNEDLLDMVMLNGRTPASGLLRGYAETLMTAESELDFALAERIGDHLCDLAALALGASEDGRERGVQGVATRDARLHRAKTFIDRRLGDGRLNENDLAAHLAISPSAVRKLFDESGISVGRYIRLRRLERANRMLTQASSSHHRIVDIALACGFESLSSFYRVFRQTYGITPSQRREEAVGALPFPPACQE